MGAGVGSGEFGGALIRFNEPPAAEATAAEATAAAAGGNLNGETLGTVQSSHPSHSP